MYFSGLPSIAEGKAGCIAFPIQVRSSACPHVEMKSCDYGIERAVNFPAPQVLYMGLQEGTCRADTDGVTPFGSVIMYAHPSGHGSPELFSYSLQSSFMPLSR